MTDAVLAEVADLDKEVDEQVKAEIREHAKHELTDKKHEIENAKRIVRNLEMEYKDILARTVEALS